ncbi:hypothetical protein T484DRAFT_1822168 [Baffinella frigidus]|nr:hypothetical protein T484DRAFT_1822168 [Cryptophyta sp. CCMP2293]
MDPAPEALASFLTILAKLDSAPSDVEKGSKAQKRFNHLAACAVASSSSHSDQQLLRLDGDMRTVANSVTIRMDGGDVPHDFLDAVHN